MIQSLSTSPICLQRSDNPENAQTEPTMGQKTVKIALIALAVTAAVISTAAFVWTTLQTALVIAIPCFIAIGCIVWYLKPCSSQVTGIQENQTQNDRRVQEEKPLTEQAGTRVQQRPIKQCAQVKNEHKEWLNSLQKEAREYKIKKHRGDLLFIHQPHRKAHPELKKNIDLFRASPSDRERLNELLAVIATAKEMD